MISTTVAACIAIAAFVVPGLIVGWCAGLRVPWAIGASLPITAGVFATLAYVYGRNGTRITEGSLIAGTLAVAVLCLLWRYAFYRFDATPRRTPVPALEGGGAQEVPDAGVTKTKRRLWILDPMWLIPGAGVVAGAWLMIHRSLSAIEATTDGLANVYQGWDSLWHASVVRNITDTGVGSATLMGPLQNHETRNELFYPTAWHVMTYFFQAVSDIPPVEAVNVSSVVLPSVALPFSAAFLGWMAIGRRGIAAAWAAALAAVIVSGVVPLFYIGYFVAAWPYITGMAMVGICAALFAQVTVRPITILPAGIALAGAGMMHPSVVTVVGMLVASWWLFYRLWVPSARGRETVWKVSRPFPRAVVARVRDAVYMAAALLVAVMLVAPQFIEGLGLTEEVEAVSDQQPVDRWGSWELVLEMQTRHARDFGVDWLLLWLGAGGAVAMLVWRRNVWLPLAYLGFVLVAVDSVKNFDGWLGDVTRIVGSLHYNTNHRLIMPVALLVAVAAAVFVAGVLRIIFGGWLDTRRDRAQGRWRRTSAAVAGAGTVAAVVAGVVLVNTLQKPQGAAYHFGVAALRNYRQVDADEIAAYQWLAQQPRAYEGVIANNADEGSGWMYPLQGLPAVHRHYLQPKVDGTSATSLMMWNPDLLGTGLPGRDGYANVVDFAAKDLGVTYIVVSPPPIWSFQKTVPAQVEGLWSAPGVTPVYKAGRTSIFAVNAAFTDAELQALRAEGASPDKLPLLGPRGPEGTEFPRPETWDRALADRDFKAELRREAQKLPGR